MFVFHSSYVHLLEMIAFQCRLASHFYLREVAGDGSVLGGLEIEVVVGQQGAKPKRLFFWVCISAGSRCPFEEVGCFPSHSFSQGIMGLSSGIITMRICWLIESLPVLLLFFRLSRPCVCQ
ncbi:hypothetical protein VPH35_051412 [Triticum aestivum]